MVYCPECETDLDIDEDEVDEGAVVSCPECGSDFEVITVNPIELKMVGEDEIDDEDEDEEDAAKKEDDEDEDDSKQAPALSHIRHCPTIAGIALLVLGMLAPVRPAPANAKSQRPYALIFGTVFDPDGHTLYAVKVRSGAPAKRRPAGNSIPITLANSPSACRPASAITLSGPMSKTTSCPMAGASSPAPKLRCTSTATSAPISACT